MTLRINTHPHPHHADETCAIETVRLAHPNDDILLSRSRDKDVMENSDINIDVGHGEYDHHQRGGNGCRENGVQYASFGLVWRDYGPFVVRELSPKELTTEQVKDICEVVDKILVQGIDAQDNGQPLYDNVSFEGMQVKTISHCIASFNAVPDFEGNNPSKEEIAKGFNKALEFANHMIRKTVLGCIKTVLSVGKFKEWAKESPSKEILVMGHFSPWQGIVHENFPEAKVVIYPTLERQFAATCVPNQPGNPAAGNKCLFPESWAGKNGEDLSQEAKVAGCVFCHRGRFMVKNETLEGAIKMVELALEK